MALQTKHFVISLVGTKTEIEAVTGLAQGSRIAYATDTDEFGTFDGSVWHWGADIPFFPIGSLTSDNVGDALDELDADKADMGHIHAATEIDANGVTVNTGTLASGNVNSLLESNDGNVLHVDEVTGVPGFDVEVDFQSVTDFDQLHVRMRYAGGATHNVDIEIYNNNTASWDTFESISNQSVYTWVSAIIPDATDYINAGEVLVRFYHTSSGNASHDLYLDHVQLLLSAGGGGAAWDGDITDIDETSSADIGEAIADDDQGIIYNTSGMAWVRFAWSRVWTYIFSKFASESVAVYTGAWNSGTSYVEGNIVWHGNAIYICNTAHSNQQPPNASYWDFLGWIITGPGDTNVTGAELEELTDGSATTLHSHADIPDDGWIPYATVVPTRTAADDPTYTLQFAGVDLTGILEEGQPIKWTQNSIVRYGFINSAPSFSTNTTITVLTHCNNASANYDVLDTSTYPITAFAYGLKKTSPFGFPIDPDYWTVKLSDTTDAYKNSPTAFTWYNLGVDGGTSSLSIVKPLGKFFVSAKLSFDVLIASSGAINGFFTLSTDGSTETNVELSRGGAYNALIFMREPFEVSPVLFNSSAKTTLYLMGKSNVATSYIRFRGDLSATTITLLCAYL